MIDNLYFTIRRFVFRHALMGVALLCMTVAFPTRLLADEPYQAGLVAFNQGNFVEAERIWWQLAQLGDAQSQFYLGVLYDTGPEPVGKDDAKAFQWFEKAAGQGHVNAQFNLGNAYMHGRGTQKDLKQAVHWWRQAAEAGSASAQFNLALQYYRGGGVEKNWDKAVEYFNLAASNGHSKAKQLLESGQVPRLEASVQRADHATSSPAGEAQPAQALPPSASGSVSPQPQAQQTADVAKPTPAADWLKAQNPQHYTIQLAVASSDEGLDRLVARHKLAEAVKVPVQRDGKRLYYLLMGSFAERRQANLRIESLTAELRTSKPWARSFAELQSLAGASY